MGHESRCQLMSSPAITIIVPCRATETPTLTLESLAKQTYRDFSVHVITDYRGHGAPWARNFGLSQRTRTTPYVLFSDADIQWEKNALEIMVMALEQAKDHEHINALPTMKEPWLTGYAYGGYYLREPTMFKDTHAAFRGPIGNEPWDYDTLLNRNFVSTMSLIRSEALAELGPTPWDESLRRLQDWDVWLKLALAGWRGVWTGGVTFTTPIRAGVSFATANRAEHDGQDGISYAEAKAIVCRKHSLI